MSDDAVDYTDEPSTYVWKWTVWSSACVGIGVLVIAMFLALGDALAVGIILGALIAVAGGIGFGFVPRAALNQPERPMTPRAYRKTQSGRNSTPASADTTDNTPPS